MKHTHLSFTFPFNSAEGISPVKELLSTYLQIGNNTFHHLAYKEHQIQQKQKLNDIKDMLDKSLHTILLSLANYPDKAVMDPSVCCSLDACTPPKVTIGHQTF